MFNRIRDRFGTAGLVVSIMALVLALAGGAFAASGGLNAKQKKQVKAIAKGLVPTGPVGPAGPAGANGQDGAAGGQGIQGIAGTDGKTVLSGTATPTGADGTDGDFYIETDVSKIYGPKAGGVWPAGVDLKGATGDPWTAGGTLPIGATLTGAWNVDISSTGTASAQASFPIPLATPITSSRTHMNDGGGGTGDLTSGSRTVANLTTTSGIFTRGAPISGTGIPAGTTIATKAATSLTLSQAATATGTAVPLTESVFAECENAVHPGSAGPSNPEAGSGRFCAYNGKTTNPAPFAGAFLNPSADFAPGTAVSGVLMGFSGSAGDVNWGTWAVTG